MSLGDCGSGKLSELWIGLGLTDDSVRVMLDSENSDDMRVGSGTLGREGIEIVGVAEDERISTGVGEGSRLINELGEESKMAGDDAGAVVGRKIDVSNEVSKPSGMAILGAVGEARKIEESYERSVSAAHSDSGIDGLERLGCSTVEGTVSEDGSLELVGVTDDSVGLEIVEGVLGRLGGCSEEARGEGPGKDTEETLSTLGVSIVEGDDIESCVGPKSDRRLVVGRDRDEL